MMTPKIGRTERRKIFGTPGRITGTVRKRIVKVSLGLDLSMTGRFKGRSMNVYAHDLIAAWFETAVTEAVLVSGWKPRRIDSYVPRLIRGSRWWSRHAFGLAWDMFTEPYPQTPAGGVWRPTHSPPAEFVKVMEKYGFTWGGRWYKRRDTPHFEWNRGLPPTTQTQTSKPEEGYVKIVVVLPILRRGDRNAGVRKMQGQLVAHTPHLDLDRPPGFVDGKFGPATDAVFREWQKARGLKIDGICGRQSWVELVGG